MFIVASCNKSNGEIHTARNMKKCRSTTTLPNSVAVNSAMCRANNTQICQTSQSDWHKSKKQHTWQIDPACAFHGVYFFWCLATSDNLARSTNNRSTPKEMKYTLGACWWKYTRMRKATHGGCLGHQFLHWMQILIHAVPVTCREIIRGKNCPQCKERLTMFHLGKKTKQTPN